MGFVILVFAKPVPMASRGQCTPGFFKNCKAFGVNAGKKLALTLPNEANGTPIFLNSHAPAERHDRFANVSCGVSYQGRIQIRRRSFRSTSRDT